MDDQVQDEAGRALVRRLLVDRLAQAGLQRPVKLGEGGFAVMAEHLVGRLAYMSPANLETLADVILTHAATQVGPVKRWPAEVLVVGWAEGLQRRPFRQARIVSSWLTSIEGPQAQAAGYLTELYRWLRVHQRPPLAYDLNGRDGVRDKAAFNARQVELIRDRMARDCCDAVDRAWLADYLRDAQEAADLVDKGRAARAAAASGEVAA